MNRSRSPLSENAIGRIIDEEFLDNSFVSNASVCSEDSDSSESGLFGDNTDDDPDYIPSSDLDQPGPSNRNVQTRPTQCFVSSDELSDEDVSPQPRARGRPRTVIPDSSDENSDEDGSGWIEVNEENDPGYENFSCSDRPSVKHCPNRNSPPVSYFNLFFTPVILDMFVKYTNLYANSYLRNI
ncbi:hypothetical protein J6590_028894 [Homalodisca vitripennis]|nr:hypothetical protein J6590_028894 [Homalodisca vitripennis]